MPKLINDAVLDRDEVAFKRIFAGTGAIPRQEFFAMTWDELLSTRNSLNTAINSVLEESDENGSPTEEIGRAASYAGLVLDSLQSEINGRDRNNDRSPRASGRRSDSSKPGTTGSGYQTSMPSGPAGSYHALFGINNGSGGSPWKNIGEFARDVAINHPRLHEVRNEPHGMTEMVGGDGGYFVPTQFLAGLVDGSLQEEAVRPRALVVPMTSAELKVPMFDTSDRTFGFGAPDPATVGEGVTPSLWQKAKTRTMTLRCHKLMILIPCTSELLDDSGPVLSTLLSQHMVSSMSQRLDGAFITGNEPAGPLGIVNASCTVSVAKETSQVAATVVPQNLAKMIARLAPGSFKKAVWLAHPSVLASLFVMAVTVKNVAATENVGGFGPNWFAVNADGSMSLLGRPLIVSDRCQPLGTKGDIILADLSQYIVGMRQDARLAIDNSIGFQNDEIWFRLTMRVDGQPLLDKPITPRKGSATLSPFVVLDART